MERVLRGENIRLRPLRREDLPRRLEMVNDPEVQRLRVGVPADQNTLEDLEMWVYLVSQGPPSELWAVATADGPYVRDIDFHSIHEVPVGAGVPVLLGER